MTVRELKEQLRNMPDGAMVYVWADHGQTECKSFGVYVSTKCLDRMPSYDFDEELEFEPITIDTENIIAVSIYSE